MSLTPSDGITVVLEMWNSFPDQWPTFAVAGSCKQLGWWSPNRAIIAEPIGETGREWRVVITVPRWYSTIEYKWMTINPITMEAIEWEDGPVHVLPLRQKTEKVYSWFNSNGSVTKILPINHNDTTETHNTNFKRCLNDVQIYIDYGFDVEIRYEYYTSDVIWENQMEISDGRPLHHTDREQMQSCYNCNAESSSMTSGISTQIARSSNVLLAELTCPGGAADDANSPEVVHVEEPFWKRALSWKSLACAGFFVGASLAMVRLSNSSR